MIIKIDTNEINTMDDLANQVLRVIRETKWKMKILKLEERDLTCLSGSTNNKEVGK